MEVFLQDHQLHIHLQHTRHHHNHQCNRKDHHLLQFMTLMVPQENSQLATHHHRQPTLHNTCAHYLFCSFLLRIYRITDSCRKPLALLLCTTRTKLCQFQFPLGINYCTSVCIYIFVHVCIFLVKQVKLNYLTPLMLLRHPIYSNLSHI